MNITQPDTFRVKTQSDNKNIYFRYILQDFQTDVAVCVRRLLLSISIYICHRVSFLVCPMDSSRKSPTQNKTGISDNRYDID